MTKRVLLAILDGWGLGDGSRSDAISCAHTPFMDSLRSDLPNSTLVTFGESVGLPEGQMGNSEVGHLNIGAGRVVYQDLVRINNAISSGELEQNPALLEAFRIAREKNRKLHFMGLVSDGGVHSRQTHLHYLIDLALKHGLEKIFIHAFTDGRDTDPKSGEGFVGQLFKHIRNTPARIASISGRYYAMDRDKRWERVAKAYKALLGKGKQKRDPLEVIRQSYDEGISDEFIEPTVIVSENGKPVGPVEPDDVVIVFNFRTDRCREITEVLTQAPLPEFNMEPLPLHYYTMTRYDKNYRNVKVLFENQDLSATLGEVLSDAGKTQVRVAETEKYPHVTFFFSGGREQPFPGEDRILVNSPKVATYDLQPEMSAEEVTQKLLSKLENDLPDFVCLNFANPDMVGHTGVYPAIIAAVEKVDSCMERIYWAARKAGYSVIIIADHGNADFVINPDGSPNTAHTMNPVPVLIADDSVTNVRQGKLSDIAPTVLKIMGISRPEQMTGTPLF